MKALILLVAFAGLSVAPSPEAQDLAQACVSELGWDGTAEECAAIHDVWENRARYTGLTYRQMARAYSTRVFQRSRTDARRWIAWLHPDGRQPRGWPSAVAWEGIRPKWVRWLAIATAIHNGQITHKCDGEPGHWGSRYHPIDRARAARAIRAGRWARLDCGPTANAFFRVLRRSP